MVRGATTRRSSGAASLLVLLVAAVASAVRGAEAFYGAGSGVVELTADNFESKIKKAGGAWLVEFYAPWCGHCQQLKPAWEQVAKALQGIVTVAAVDCDAHKEVAAQHGVQGFPTIKFFYVSSSGAVKSSEYKGGRAAKELAAFALDKAKALAFKRLGEKPPPSGGGGSSGGKARGGGAGAGAGAGGDGFYGGTEVVTLTDGSFDEEVLQSDDIWFVEFYAPWCGHCKQLKPAWIDAAEQLKGRVRFGAVDCTAHQSTCGQYGVQGYPTIKVFGSNKNSPSDYQGGRDSGSIAAAATKEWAENAKPREVRELVDQAVLEAECLGVDSEGVPEKSKAAQLCFVAFLPDVRDSKASGRRAYIDALKALAADYKDRSWAYLWAEGGAQPALEASLGVGGFGYPALVALKPSDLKYSTMRSAFEAAALKDFIRNLRYEPVAPVTDGKLGEVVTKPAWDGQDAPEEAVDEFSLEDLMGDDEGGEAAEEEKKAEL